MIPLAQTHRRRADGRRPTPSQPPNRPQQPPRWGDHLYSKGEYDAAMAQYGETIGQLEPSYVIRRFLDAQRIHSLTSYLEQLHHRVGVNLVWKLVCWTEVGMVEIVII